MMESPSSTSCLEQGNGSISHNRSIVLSYGHTWVLACQKTMMTCVTNLDQLKGAAICDNLKIKFIKMSHCYSDFILYYVNHSH